MYYRYQMTAPRFAWAATQGVLGLSLHSNHCFCTCSTGRLLWGLKQNLEYISQPEAPALPRYCPLSANFVFFILFSVDLLEYPPTYKDITLAAWFEV